MEKPVQVCNLNRHEMKQNCDHDKPQSIWIHQYAKIKCNTLPMNFLDCFYGYILYLQVTTIEGKACKLMIMLNKSSNTKFPFPYKKGYYINIWQKTCTGRYNLVDCANCSAEVDTKCSCLCLGLNWRWLPFFVR